MFGFVPTFEMTQIVFQNQDVKVFVLELVPGSILGIKRILLLPNQL